MKRCLSPCATISCCASCRLPTCGALRGNGARASGRATWASCRPCGDREVSRRPQSCPTRLVRQAVRSAAAPKRAALATSGRVRRVARRPPLRFGHFGLRPQSRACVPSSASLPFAGRPLPPPASANPRAVLRRRGAGSSPRASFAARAANRARPSLSARRSAAPPAPHATFFLSCAGHIHPPLTLHDSRRSSRSGDVRRPWPGGADSRARGRRGSPIASGLSLVETHSAEGNALSRHIG